MKSEVVIRGRERAKKVCDQGHLEAEMEHLKRTFKTNVYPLNLIEKGLHRQTQAQPPQQDTCNQEKPKLLYLPYVRQTSK